MKLIYFNKNTTVCQQMIQQHNSFMEKASTPLASETGIASFSLVRLLLDVMSAIGQTRTSVGEMFYHSSMQKCLSSKMFGVSLHVQHILNLSTTSHLDSNLVFDSITLPFLIFKPILGGFIFMLGIIMLLKFPPLVQIQLLDDGLTFSSRTLWYYIEFIVESMM